MTNNYTHEKSGYTMTTVAEEAARCLLCHDAPCSKACPANTDPAKFIRSVRFRNIKGAADTIRTNNALGAICARSARPKSTVNWPAPGAGSIPQSTSVGSNATSLTSNNKPRWTSSKRAQRTA